MAILEKEVEVKWNVNNRERYISKGYNYTNIGEKFIVQLKDLSKGCTSKVTRVCDQCGFKNENLSFKDVIKQRKNHQDLCRECAYLIRNKKANVKYEKSLECFALNNNLNYLLNEFSNKNLKPPNEIYRSSKDNYLWDCPNCKSEYVMSALSRVTQKQNCPYCSGRRVNETNCLWTTHPGIAEKLLDKNIGYSISHGSSIKLLFKCSDCGEITKPKYLPHVISNGLSCHRCSDGISYPEKFMACVLDQLNQEYSIQKSFNWAIINHHVNKNLIGKKRYDFYLHSKKLIIETHGSQHYDRPLRVDGRTVEEEKENDELKKILAHKNGIEDYVTVDCSKSEIHLLKQNIINALSCYFDLMNIDWEKCHERAIKSFVKDVSDLWNGGMQSTKKISNVLKLSVSTVRKYLKQAKMLNWCDYDPVEAKKVSDESKKKSIVQLCLDTGDFIEKWDSMTDVYITLNISQTVISRNCNNKQMSAGGYRWMYKEDYDQYIKQTN